MAPQGGLGRPKDPAAAPHEELREAALSCCPKLIFLDSNKMALKPRSSRGGTRDREEAPLQRGQEEQERREDERREAGKLASAAREQAPEQRLNTGPELCWCSGGSSNQHASPGWAWPGGSQKVLGAERPSRTPAQLCTRSRLSPSSSPAPRPTAPGPRQGPCSLQARGRRAGAQAGLGSREPGSPPHPGLSGIWVLTLGL